LAAHESVEEHQRASSLGSEPCGFTRGGSSSWGPLTHVCRPQRLPLCSGEVKERQ
jgi:hypothetical protein